MTCASENNFDLIKNIDLEGKDSSAKFYITLDMDWAPDEVLAITLDLLESLEIKATIFITNHTKLLERMRANPNIELAIHPNFNFLLQGDSRCGGGAQEVLSRCLELVPEAVSIRSHSLTTNSYLSLAFLEAGLKYECNLFLPPYVGINNPFKTWSGLVAVPHIFQDDMSLRTGGFDLRNIISCHGVKVLVFHPVHIFLNTDSLHTYEKAKRYYKNPAFLKKYIVKNKYGVRSCLIDLVGFVKGGKLNGNIVNYNI